MPPALGSLIVSVDVLGLMAGAWLLWRPGRRPAASLRGDVAILVGLGAVLGGVASPLAWLATGTAFSVARLGCHILFCVLAPLAMAHGVAHLARARLRAGFLLLTVGLAMDAVYLYARRVEPFDLQVRRYRIAVERLPADESVRIVVLADLQAEELGRYERSVFRRIDAERADLLLLAGDFLQIDDPAAYRRERARLVALLRGLRHRPRLGVYGVLGDTERSRDVLAGSGVRMLEDETVRLRDSLQLVGLAYRSGFVPLRPELRRRAEEFDGFTIFLGHRPDFMETIVRDGSSLPLLCIAGHTHGGQVVLPGFGPPVTYSRLPRRYAGGLHRRGAAHLAISRGVGMERGVAPRIRFLCPPELVVLELRGAVRRAPSATAPPVMAVAGGAK